MKRNWLYMILVLLAGAGGAALRGMSLLYGYEDTGLPVRGYFQATALIVLTVVVVVGFSLISRVMFAGERERSFEQLFCGMSAGASVLGILCGVGLTALSAVGLLSVPAQMLEQSNEYVSVGVVTMAAMALVWVLGIVAGVSMALLANGQRRTGEATRALGVFATLPMFWCCLDLIMIYHENSGNPVTSDYSYLLLLVIAVMTAFYSMAGFLFAARGSATRFFAASGIGVYLACTHVGGELIRAELSGGVTAVGAFLETGDTVRVGMYLCAGIYLLVQLANALAHVSRRDA